MVSIKPIIRSVAGFTRLDIEWSRNGLRNAIEHVLDLVDKACDLLSGAGYTIWSKRISLPIPPVTVYDRLPDILSDIVSKDYMVSTGCVFLEEMSIEKIIDIVSNGIYICLIWGKEPDAVKATDVFLRASEYNPVYATRIALSLDGTPLETPYYPLSTSLYGESIGIAFLYPSYLESIFSKRGLRGIRKTLLSLEKDIANVLNDLGVRVSIDYSISPWMEDSVAGLIESITGYTPDKPGFLHGIYVLNSILGELRGVSRLMQGYNEVMLPYAEDSILMKYGGEGRLRARDFLRFSSVCIAGPDMIVVPMDRVKLLGYIRDALALGRVKGRYMGLRIIAVNRDAGERIDLGKFGSVPILDY